MADTIQARFSSATLIGACSLALASCGDDAVSFDCPSAGRPNHVRLLLPGAAHDVVALRTGDGQWELLPKGQSVIDTCVAGHYVWGVSCAGPDFAAVVQYARTAADSDQVQAFQCGGSEKYVHVTGTMRQPGAVSVGTSLANGLTEGWNYSHFVAQGVHDLVASDASVTFAGRSNRMALRRGRRYTNDTTEPEIDLSTEGVDMVPVTLAVSGLEQDDSFVTEVWLRTLSGASDEELVVFRDRTLAAYRVPLSLLELGETDAISFEATSASYRRSTISNSSSFELLPRLTTGVMLEPGVPSRATWSVLPLSPSELTLSESGDGGSRRVLATQAWIDATSDNALSFDTSMPGLDPRTLFVGTQAEFGVYARDAETQRSSFVKLE